MHPLILLLAAAMPAEATSCEDPECLRQEVDERCYAPFVGRTSHGDIDGDGDMDLVVRLRIWAGAELEEADTDSADPRFESTLAWLPNEGGTLGAPTSIGPAGMDIQLVDLDGDGDLDVLSTGPGVHRYDSDLHEPQVMFATEPQWWRNDGSGAFAQMELPGLPTHAPFAVRAIDIDEDGLIDLVSEVDQGSQVFWNDGGGNFAAGPTLRIVRPTFADLDGDGDRELVGDSLDSGIWIYDVDARTVTDSGRTLSQFGGSNIVAIDMDGDGDEDLVSPNTTYLVDGDELEISYKASDARFDTVEVVDVDGDGHLDVVRAGDGGLQISYGDGARVVEPPRRVWESPALGWLVLDARGELGFIDWNGVLSRTDGSTVKLAEDVCGDVPFCAEVEDVPCGFGCSTLTLVVPLAWTPFIAIAIRRRRKEIAELVGPGA